MPLGIEHRVVHDLDRTHDCVLIDEHRGDHGLFGILAVRRTPVAVGITPGGCLCDRVFVGQAERLPRWGVSTPDSEDARRGGRSQ